MQTFVGVTNVATTLGTATVQSGREVWNFGKELAFWILGTLPAIILCTLIIIFSVSVYHEHHNVILSEIEHVWRADVYPELDFWLGNMLRPVLEGLRYLITASNFWTRLNKIISKNAIIYELKLSLIESGYAMRDEIFNAVKSVATGIADMIIWFVTNLLYMFTYHAPFYQLFHAVTYDAIPILADFLCNACELVCSLVKFVLIDIPRNNSLLCSLHHIANAIFQLGVEVSKVVIYTLWRLIFYGEWNPYAPELELAGKTFVVGATHLGRYAGEILQRFICRFVGVIASAVDDDCAIVCDAEATNDCILSESPTCYADRLSECMTDCRDAVEESALETCTDSLKPLRLIGDIVGVAIAAVGHVLFQVADKALILPSEYTNTEFLIYALGNVNMEPFYDMIRTPVFWYTHGGSFELTPYSRASTMYLDSELINATTQTCLDSYPREYISCSQCSHVLISTNPDRVLSISESLCEIGQTLDDLAGLPAEHPIFKYIFCRLLGAALRLAVSLARYITNMLSALLLGIENPFYALLGYVGDEQRYFDLYHDSIYAADTIGWLLPSFIGENRFYPVKVIVAFPFKLVIEIAYDALILLSRIFNELLRLFTGTTDGTRYYLADFFCTGHNYCIRIKPISRLFRVPRPVVYAIDVCPALPPLWDVTTNTSGEMELFEALCHFINFDEFLAAFGVFFNMPDICCGAYHLARGVVDIAELLLEAILGFLTLGDYLFCRDPLNGQCAPFANIICEATYVLECPCKFLGDRNSDEGSLGLPCACEVLDTVAYLVRDAARFLLSIFRVIDSGDMESVLDAYYQLTGVHAANGTQETTALYTLADGISCLLSLFLPEQCAAPLGLIRYNFRDLLVSVVRVVAYVFAVVGKFAELFINQDTTQAIRDFLDELLRGAFTVLVGNNDSTDEFYGIVQRVGFTVSCLLGPANCSYACSDGDGTMCLGNFLTCLGDFIRNVAEHLVNAILYFYDIVALLITGVTDAADLKDAIIAFVSELWDLVQEVITGALDFLWGMIAGVLSAIFGDWMYDVVMFVKDVMSVAINIIIFIVNLFSGGGDDEAMLSKRWETSPMDQFFTHALPPPDALMSFIKEHSNEVVANFTEGTWCHTIMLDAVRGNKAAKSKSDEWWIRTCLAGQMAGVNLHYSNSQWVERDDLITNPLVLLNSLNQTAHGIAEYAYMYLVGRGYKSMVDSDPRLQASAHSQYEDCLQSFDGNITEADVECVMQRIGVTEKMPVNIVKFLNQIMHFRLNTTRLLLAVVDSLDPSKRVSAMNGRSNYSVRDTNQRMLMLSASMAHESLINMKSNMQRSIKQKRFEQAGHRVGTAIGSFVNDMVAGTKPTFTSYTIGQLNADPRDYLDTRNAPFLYKFGRGLAMLTSTIVSKAWNNLANATRAITRRVSNSLATAKTYQAYEFRNGIYRALVQLHAWQPDVISADMIPNKAFLRCDDSASWCPRNDALQIYIPPIPPDGIPELNCRIVDRLIHRFVNLVNTTFYHQELYETGTFNYNLLQLHYADKWYWNLTCYVTRGLNFFGVDELDFMCGVDWGTTILEWVKNTNTDIRIGPVGLLWYISVLIPFPAIGFCYGDEAATGMIGIGLWDALKIVAVLMFLSLVLYYISIFISRTLTSEIISATASILLTFSTIAFFAVPAIAYGWTFRCGMPTEGFLIAGTGLPQLPIIPPGIINNTIEIFDWILSLGKIKIPAGLVADGNLSYINDTEAYGNFSQCQAFGFTDITASTRFLLATYIPHIYVGLVNIPGIRLLLPNDTFDYRFHAPTDEEWACFYILSIEMVGIVLLVVYAAILLALTIILIVGIIFAWQVPVSITLRFMSQSQRDYSSQADSLDIGL